MLKEEIADASLEQVMEMAKDDILKAKDSDEKKEAHERFISLHKVYNDRLKIQNDYLVAEDKNALDTEKFDHEKKVREEESIMDSRRSTRDFIKEVGFTAAKVGLVGLEVAFQGIMIHNNIIETDPVSKSATKGILGTISNYLRV